MNSHQLKVFLAVCDAASFEKGARALELSQPTVSQHIATLEKELGVRLMDRSRGGVSLTEAGKVLLGHARQIVEGIDGAQRAIEGFMEMEGAQLKIAASTIPSAYLLPQVLAPLFEENPGVGLTVLHGDSARTLDRVSYGEAEFGVVGAISEKSALHFHPWCRDEITLVAGGDHPWAARESISLEELMGEPMIRRQPGSGTCEHMERALLERGIDKATLNIRAEVGCTEALKGLAMAGVGAGFISRWGVSSELARGQLKEVRVEGLEVERNFYLVKRGGQALSGAAEALWQLLVRVSDTLATP